MHLGKSAQRNKEFYDVRLNNQEYQIGDLVWLETDRGQVDVTHKLREPYEGPYMIYEQIGPLD